MPFVNNPYEARLSDLIVMEGPEPSTGYTRKDINVTPPAASAPLQIGTVVFRAKGLDKYAPYAVVAAAADIDRDANEYAVVFGDEFGFNPSFVPFAVQTTTFNAVAIAHGPIQLKEYFLKQRHANLTDAQFSTLKEVLEVQGVEILVTR